MRIAILFGAFLLCLGAGSVQAQNYKLALGGRFGYPFALSLKYFPNEKGALEAFASYRGDDWGYGRYTQIGLNGAYQIHKDIDDVDGLAYYYGGGAGVYFYNYTYDDLLYDEDYGTTAFSIQGFLGLDYAFENTPINLSLDWRPTLWIGSGYLTGFGAGYGALAVRYIINRG